MTSTLPFSTFATDTDVHAQLAANVLPAYVNTCRWFAGKARQQSGIRVQSVLTVSEQPADNQYYLVIIEATYADGEPEQYQLPLAFVPEGTTTDAIPDKGILTPITFADKPGYLVDAIYVAGFREALFQHLAANDVVVQPADEAGQLTFQRGKGLVDSTPR